MAEKFREIEPLPHRGWREYASVSRVVPTEIYVGNEFFTVHEARQLRDWLNKALPAVTVTVVWTVPTDPEPTP